MDNAERNRPGDWLAVRLGQTAITSPRSKTNVSPFSNILLSLLLLLLLTASVV
jgi:hypothetical protein